MKKLFVLLLIGAAAFTIISSLPQSALPKLPKLSNLPSYDSQTASEVPEEPGDTSENSDYDVGAFYEQCSDALAVIASVDADTFLVREYDGKIGIFAVRNGDSNGGDNGDGGSNGNSGNVGEEPIYVLDIFVFMLPGEVAAMFRTGIECDAQTLSILYDTLTS